MNESIEMPSVTIEGGLFILHNYVNLKGKLVIGELEATLLINELWKYLNHEV